MEYKNAEYYGYKVGDKFRYRDGVDEQDKLSWFRGSDESVLTLLMDDGSDCPHFKNGNCIEGYEDLNLLVKIEDEEQPLKPQNLGCWQQVVDVIGEERAAIELQKVIGIKDDKWLELKTDKSSLEFSFVWDQTPQGYDFWESIEEGIYPEQPKAIAATVFGIVVRQCDIPDGCYVNVEKDKATICFDGKYYFVKTVDAYEKTMQAIRLLAEAKHG